MTISYFIALRASRNRVEVESLLSTINGSLVIDTFIVVLKVSSIAGLGTREAL